MRAWILPACLAAASLQAAAAGCELQAGSGLLRISLLEMYTSEGCSSCPPAEAWLSGLAAAGLDASRVVPLAFHVDYWDELGWRDRLASPDYSRRQRWRAAQAGSPLVYTPQLLLNGRDWRFAGYDGLRASLPGDKASAGLRLRGRRAGDGVDIEVETSLPLGAPPLRLMLAVFEDGLSSQVKAGENAGRLLRHDAAARGVAGPFALAGGSETLRTHLSFASGQDGSKSGVAVWLEDGQGRVRQALAARCAGG
ncbi:DUF1223 domain-containing protein [Chromobacterium phragmitis]|uniref:DUF1223 domain-containing protein n=1 Tax=Chromobacterium phragmitis TaxID=2202141 RepID=UPI000DECFF6D|nr:DUF1223 domain-containing protein [Chromobacterium phragmitis]AXE29129.1 DUF1223 domain-containing protein [Chromobacterium phragmitis]